LASTLARAGVLPGDTQESQTLFISAKLAMSVIQMLAESSFVLSVPVGARKPSICERMFLVCSATLFSFRAVGNDAGEIDGVAVDYRLAHARPGLVTFDLHG
jgi:hypothetical protein